MNADPSAESFPDPAGPRKKRRIKKKRHHTKTRRNTLIFIKLIHGLDQYFGNKRRVWFLVAIAAGVNAIAFLAALLVRLIIYPSQVVYTHPTEQAPQLQLQPDAAPQAFDKSTPGPGVAQEILAIPAQERPSGSSVNDNGMEILPDSSDQDQPLKPDDLKQIKVFEVALSNVQKEQSLVVSIHGKIRNELSRGVERLVLIVYFADETGKVISVKRFGVANITALPFEPVGFDKTVEVKYLPEGYKYHIEAVDGYYVVPGQQQ